jgi:tetratricopeptide (TPR) repeat protein
MNDARPRANAWAEESGVHPQSGAGAVAIAAIIGIAAIVGYAAMQTTKRAQTEPPTATRAAQSSFAVVTRNAAAARDSLDVVALDRAIVELDALVESSTMAMTQMNARLEMLDTLAARALEASLRSSVVPEQQRAGEHEASKAILRARELARVLENQNADPGRVQAAVARIELAVGTDITESQPIVLMPTYRDPELRLAALSAPVWRTRDAAVDPAMLAEVIAELQRAERQSALVRLITAVALRAKGDDAAALAALDEVLRTTPTQPTAIALRGLVAPGGAVAMAGAGPAPTPERGEAATAVPAPTPTPPPTPAPVDAKVAVPTPAPTKAEPAKAEPVPPKPKPEPAPAKTEPAPPKPKPEPTPVAAGEPDADEGKASNKKKYKALLDEGCKLARSGDAEKGLQVLNEAFDLNPNAVAVTVCMAEAHHKLGRDASARSMCERALRKAPNDRRALLLAAELEDARGNTSGALQHYKKILETHPDDAKAKAYVESHGG